MPVHSHTHTSCHNNRYDETVDTPSHSNNERKKCSTVLLYSLMPLPEAAHLTWTASVTSGNGNSDHIRGTGLCCLSRNNRTWQYLTLLWSAPTVKHITLTVTLSLSLSRWAEQREAACCGCLPLNRARAGIRCAYTTNTGTGSVHTHAAVYTTHTRAHTSMYSTPADVPP